MNPARTLSGPDIVAVSFTGWWAYVGGDPIGAAIAVALIGLVRGLPDKAEISAAECAPLRGLPSPPAWQPTTNPSTRAARYTSRSATIWSWLTASSSAW
jgi:hypothetical protein